MRRVLAAIANAFRSLRRRLMAGVSWAWESISDLWDGALEGLGSRDTEFERGTWENPGAYGASSERRVEPNAGSGKALQAIGSAARVTGTALGGAALLPFRAVGAVSRALVGGGGGDVADPSLAAAQAVARARQEQQRADDTADARVTLQAIRRVARARARGEKIPEDAAEILPPMLLAYVKALEVDECDALAKARTSVLRALLDEQTPPAGVRSPKEVAKDLQRAREPAPAATLEATAARKAEIRRAVQAAMRPQRRSAKDILADLDTGLMPGR